MKMTKKTFLTDDGVELAYFENGSGRETVVLMAGYGAPAISWCSQVKALNKAGIRTIAFDRRCHGLSENTDKGMNMLRHGADVDALFKALDLHDVILVGQSQGASTIWAYISQFGTERLKAVVSVDQTPKMINEGDWQNGMYGLTPESRPTFFDVPIPAPNKKPLDKGIVLYLALHAKGYPQFDMEGTRALLLDHADADWRETIAKTEVPALFVAGGESPFWPSGHAEDMAKLAPKGDFRVVAGSGHAVNWECAKEFNKLLIDFVKSL